MAYNSRIANSLQQKYRSYYRDGSGGENLSFQERRVLDALRDSPQASQLYAITPYLRDAGRDTETAKDALYNVGVALGATRPDINSLWTRLSTGQTYDLYRDLPQPQPYATERIPGEGSMQGGGINVSGRTIQRNAIVDALLPVMGDAFVDWYRGGAGVGEDTRLSFQDIQDLGRILEDPQNIDLAALAKFSRIPDSNAFLQQARDLTRDIQISRIQTGQQIATAQETAATRLDAYYDPQTSSVVYLTRAEAAARGLTEASQQQVDSLPVTQAETILSPAEIDRRTGVSYEMAPGEEDIRRLGSTTGPTGPGGPGGVPGVEGVPVETGVPPDWETAAAEMYPEYYAIVKNNPEIAALLRRSIAEDWSETKFQAELRATNWWKTTTASAREWDAASALDPATYQAKVDTAAADIQQEALNLGIRLSSERLQKLALDSERFGWGSQMITNAIGMAATEGGTAGATQLREGYYGQAVRNTARQYGVTLADSTFSSFVNKIAVGEETLGSFQDYALGIAKSLYPPLAEQFDAGRTFDEITGSYQQMAANILERDAGSIDMMDPTFVTAVTYQPDQKTGEQRMMNLQEWGNYLRNTESLGYQYTTEARSRAYEVATKFANMFGKV